MEINNEGWLKTHGFFKESVSEDDIVEYLISANSKSQFAQECEPIAILGYFCSCNSSFSPEFLRLEPFLHRRGHSATRFLMKSMCLRQRISRGKQAHVWRLWHVMKLIALNVVEHVGFQTGHKNLESPHRALSIMPSHCNRED